MPFTRATKYLFLGAIALECLYLTGRTFLLPDIASPVVKELAWTAWRLPFCAAYAWIARDALTLPTGREKWPPLLSVALALGILADPVSGYNAGGRAIDHFIMAATSPIVALREELFYRAIMLRFVERFVGPWSALLFSSAAFVAYHTGVHPMGLFGLVGLTSAAILLGSIYQLTRNLWLVVGIHTLWDVVAAGSPGVALVGPATGFYMHVVALVLALALAGYGFSASSRRET